VEDNIGRVEKSYPVQIGIVTSRALPYLLPGLLHRFL